MIPLREIRTNSPAALHSIVKILNLADIIFRVVNSFSPTDSSTMSSFALPVVFENPLRRQNFRLCLYDLVPTIAIVRIRACSLSPTNSICNLGKCSGLPFCSGDFETQICRMLKSRCNGWKLLRWCLECGKPNE